MTRSMILIAGLALFSEPMLVAQTIPSKMALTSIAHDRVETRNVEVAPAIYKGRRAERIRQTGGADGQSYAILSDTRFRDGTISVDVAGDIAPGAPAGARGFVGIAFRMSPSGQYECFYIRPANGRSENQEQRNHSTQYVSMPEYPWQMLREKFPGRYESYTDVAPGAWTNLRIVVDGEQAKLFVNGASQPSLVVNDLKHGQSEGRIALWVGVGTIAHFANLKVTPALAGKATTQPRSISVNE